MSDKTDELSVQLNEAVERLEGETASAEKPDAQQSGRQKSRSEAEASNSKTGSSAGSTARASAEKSRQPGNKPSSKPSNAGIVISLLVGFIAIGIASFGAFTALQIQSSNDSSSSEYSLNADATQAQLAQVRDEMARLEKSTGSKIASLGRSSSDDEQARSQLISQLEQKIEASTSQLKNTIGTSSEDWLVAEAEYLIRLANQKVLMEADAKSAEALLVAADEIIANAQGIVAFDLRRAIAEDVAKLRGVAALDVEGIFVTIGALVKQVDELQQRQLQFSAMPQDQGGQVEASTDFLSRIEFLLSKIAHKLSNLVDYRNDGEVITPILPPEEEYYLRQNLTMTLRLAQLGLLRSNQQIYQDSLNDAKGWVEKYFDAGKSTSKSMVRTIEKLSQISVKQDMPDVSGSLREIKRLMVGFYGASPRQVGDFEEPTLEPSITAEPIIEEPVTEMEPIQ